MLKLALTKGRLEEASLGFLEAMGYNATILRDKGRKLILKPGPDLEVVLAKSMDVITYVDQGVCDIGVVGKDNLMERPGSYYEVMDLGFGQCHFALATHRDGPTSPAQVKRVASKYTHVTHRYFAGLGLDVEVIKIEGSVELAPLLGLACAIVDIVQTGNTLRENGLVEIDHIADVSARLIVNPAALKLKQASIHAFMDGIQAWKGAIQ